MNKTQLAHKVAEINKIQKGDAELFVDTVFNVIGDTLAVGDFVNIAGFGKYDTRKTKARKGRNPQSGAEIEIAAGKKPTFKPLKGLKDKVAQ